MCSQLKEINFLLERENQALQLRKFNEKHADEQKMKERKIAEFESRLRRGEISIHLMGALAHVHRTLVVSTRHTPHHSAIERRR